MSADRFIEKKIYDLLVLKISGCATTDNLKQLDYLLSRHPEFVFLKDQLAKPAYDSIKATEHAKEAYTAHFYSKLHLSLLYSEDKHNASPSSTQPKYYRRPALLAACFISLIVITFFVFSPFAKKSTETRTDINEMVTLKGSRSTLTLPDGSTVFLNADSRISYPKNFNESSRDVILIGEAYFKVTHDAERPFVVQTPKADIKVLGTEFNVRYYPDEELFETTLIKGKVEIKINNEAQKIVTLKPSEKLILNKAAFKAPQEEDYSISDVKPLDSIITETLWIDDKLAFVNKPFSEMVPELERRFNVVFKIENKTTLKHVYTGVFEDDNVEDILNILQIIKPFNYVKQGETITIY